MLYVFSHSNSQDRLMSINDVYYYTIKENPTRDPMYLVDLRCAL